MNLKNVLYVTSLLPFFLSCGSNAYSHGLHSYAHRDPNPPLSHTLQSQFLDDDREFRVRLPLSYDQNDTKRFPVLYVLDADFQKEYMYTETENILNTLLNRHKIPELITVYLPNKSDNERIRDHTPSIGAVQFIDHIEQELIPFIDSNYRTQPLRLIQGQSLTGLFVTRILLSRPHLFKAYIALSPALWKEDDHEIEFARNVFQSLDEQFDNYFYMNIGGEENENITNSFDRMKYLLNRYNPSGLSWRADYAEFESHGSTRPIGLYLGLREYFSNWSNRYKSVETWVQFEANGGLDPFLDNFGILSVEYGYDVKPEILHELGEYFLTQEKHSDAIRSFELHAEYFPQSIEAYYGLAVSHKEIGKFEEALLNIEIAEELNMLKPDDRYSDLLSSLKQDLGY